VPLAQNFLRLCRLLFFPRYHDPQASAELFTHRQRERVVFFFILLGLVLLPYMAFLRRGIDPQRMLVNALILLAFSAGLLLLLTGRVRPAAYIPFHTTNLLYGINCVVLILRNDTMRSPSTNLQMYLIVATFVVVYNGMLAGRRHALADGAIILLVMTACFGIGRPLFLAGELVTLGILYLVFAVMVYFMLGVFETALGRLTALTANLEQQVLLRTAEYVQQKEAAEQANRAKSAFLSNVSHDLRTPLNAIIGFTELLARQQLAGRERQYLDNIRRSGDELLNLINGLLDITRIEANRIVLTPAPVDLHRELAQLQSEYRMRLAGTGVQFALVSPPADGRHFWLDPISLRRVLHNLLHNACKHTVRGSIELRTECTPRDAQSVDLLVVVRDTGSGIPAALQPIIFDPFVQDHAAPAAADGLGLGLTIVKRLVIAMGGTVALTSTPGQGTTVTLHLPAIRVVAADTHPAVPASDTMMPALCRPLSCLIVDDLAPNRLLLTAMLERLGCSAAATADPRQVVALTQAQQPDLIFLDLRMPVLDGYAVLKLLRADALLAAVPVIAVTASVTPESETRARQAGFNAFLRKPVTIAELMRALRQCCPQALLAPTPESAPAVAVPELTGSFVDLSPDDQAQLLAAFSPEGIAEFATAWRAFSLDRLDSCLRAARASVAAAGAATAWLDRQLTAIDTFSVDTLQVELQQLATVLLPADPQG